MEMERSRPAEKRACFPVPDRHGERLNLPDGRHNVSVEVHQFETEALHLAADEVERLGEHRHSPRSPLLSIVSGFCRGNE
jgi:hypothetical protein